MKKKRIVENDKVKILATIEELDRKKNKALHIAWEKVCRLKSNLSTSACIFLLGIRFTLVHCFVYLYEKNLFLSGTDLLCLFKYLKYGAETSISSVSAYF